MDEEKIPLIHICGTVSEQDFSGAVRARGIRIFLKFLLFYLLAMVLIGFGTSFYSWYPYIRNGSSSYAEWIDGTWNSFFSMSFTTSVIIGLIAVYAVLCIGVRPMRARKRFHELYSEGAQAVYDFFDDQLVIRISSSTADETFRLKYSDVRRKIKETRYLILLSTGQKNRVALYKAVMTPDQTERTRKLLNERCPQRRP
jgi:hypothetical protein